LTKRTTNISKTDHYFLDAIPGSAAILDVDGYVTAVNNGWDKGDNCPFWIDLNKSNINIYQHCQKMVAEGNGYALQMILNLREITDRKKTSSELTVSVGEGGNSWCKVSISLIDGDPIKILLIFTDVSSSMQALMSLRDSEEKYSHHFKHWYPALF